MNDWERSVTIGLALAETETSAKDGRDAAKLHRQVAERHIGRHDMLIVAVPSGRGREARDLIWEALGTTPAAPSPSEGTLAATSADADYIRRAYVGP